MFHLKLLCALAHIRRRLALDTAKNKERPANNNDPDTRPDRNIVPLLIRYRQIDRTQLGLMRFLSHLYPRRVRSNSALILLLLGALLDRDSI